MVIIDDTNGRWWSWVKQEQGTTEVGYVSSVPEAMRRARENGYTGNQYMLLSDKIPMRVN